VVARLPASAILKTWRDGDQPASAVQPGTQVIAYCVPSRDIKVVRVVSVTPIPPQDVLQVEIQNFRIITGFPETEAFTARGLQRLDSLPSMYQTYCVMNPKRLASRTPLSVFGNGAQAGVLVEWDTDDYLYAEGLLVGST